MATKLYDTSNWTLDTASTLYGGSNLRVLSSRVKLAFNRPAKDSDHSLYARLEDGSGNTITDDSDQAHNGSKDTGLNQPAWQSLDTAPSVLSHAITIGNNQYVTIGAHLNYERTQAWTMYGWIKTAVTPGTGGAAIIFSNVDASPYTGYEVWINDQGKIHCRIMNAFGSNYVGVYGETVVTDGKWHNIIVTYAGNSLASGVKIYIDGTLQTKTTESDNLSATIVVSGNAFRIGNQTGLLTSYYLNGGMDQFMMFNVEQNSTWVSTYSSRDAFPSASDTNCVLSLAFDNNTGTSATDGSASGFTGTLQSSTMWAAEQICNWCGDSVIQFFGVDTVGLTFTQISAYDLPTEFTISAWVNSTVATTLGCLFYHLHSTGSFEGWAVHLGYDAGSGAKFQFWDGGDSAFKSSGQAQAAGWHYYTVERASTSIKFYVDGGLVTSVSGAQPNAFNTSLLVGRWPSLPSANQLLGYLSHFSISKVARGATYNSTYATRFPASGVFSLTSPGNSVASGGGDLGSDQDVTNIACDFVLPSTAVLEYRIGVGSSAANATSAKTSASYATLSASTPLSGLTGRYVDYDIRLKPTTDSLKKDTPIVKTVTLTYSQPASQASAATMTMTTPTPTLKITANPSAAILNLTGLTPVTPVKVTPSTAIVSLQNDASNFNVKANVPVALLNLTTLTPTTPFTLKPLSAIINLISDNPKAITTVKPTVAIVNLLSDPIGGSSSPGVPVLTLVANDPKITLTVTPAPAVLQLTETDPLTPITAIPTSAILSPVAVVPTINVKAVPIVSILNLVANDLFVGGPVTLAVALLRFLVDNPSVSIGIITSDFPGFVRPDETKPNFMRPVDDKKGFTLPDFS